MECVVTVLLLGVLCSDGVRAATTTSPAISGTETTTPGAANNDAPHTEMDLHAKLFAKYNPDVMPLRNTSQAIGISVQLYLMSFDNLDEKKQTFTARGFLELTWKDEFLVWNSSDYGGVKSINVRNENIWLPDMALERTFDKPTDVGLDGDRSIVDEHGSVVTWPYKSFTLGCKLSIKKFPFDEQTCEFDFLSWTNPVSKLYLKTPADALQLSLYAESGEWDLASHEVHHSQNAFGDDAWDHVVFRFTLRRKWLFQMMNMLAPVICIALLNVTCFILPPESGEKITLSISIFLTLAVFLTIVTSALPENSDEVSILGVYIGLQLMGSGLTILTTVISLYMYHIGPSRPVPWVFRCMCRLCCVSAPPQNDERPECRSNGEIVHSTSNNVTELAHIIKPAYPTDTLTEHTRGNTGPYKRQPPPVTWMTVARGFDRLCLVMGLAWHALLLSAVIISVKN